MPQCPLVSLSQLKKVPQKVEPAYYAVSSSKRSLIPSQVIMPVYFLSLFALFSLQSMEHNLYTCRCANNPLIGRPHKITTVDKFQGQQNDYILLSLVKTKNVGHLRDVRRLVVAMSRARLGLYVFGRINLFRNCFELQPAFNLLCKRPNELHLCPNEVRDYKRFKPHSKWIPLD